MVRTIECDYCGSDIEPGTGTMLVKNDGSTTHFCSSKCENNADLGREARNLGWTESGRDAKPAAEESAEAKPEAAADEAEVEEEADDAETADDSAAEDADADAESDDAEADDAEDAEAGDEAAEADADDDADEADDEAEEAQA